MLTLDVYNCILIPAIILQSGLYPSYPLFLRSKLWQLPEVKGKSQGKGKSQVLNQVFWLQSLCSSSECYSGLSLSSFFKNLTLDFEKFQEIIVGTYFSVEKTSAEIIISIIHYLWVIGPLSSFGSNPLRVETLSSDFESYCSLLWLSDSFIIFLDDSRMNK